MKDYERRMERDTLLEAYRLLLQEALRIESGSENVFVHYGNPPEDSVVDPIPIEEYLDICVPYRYVSSPETVLLVYHKCREAMEEFKWGEVDDSSH